MLPRRPKHLRQANENGDKPDFRDACICDHGLTLLIRLRGRGIQTAIEAAVNGSKDTNGAIEKSQLILSRDRLSLPEFFQNHSSNFLHLAKSGPSIKTCGFS